MVSIGIGITTYNRPECLKECLDNIAKYTDHTPLTLYVAKDTDEDRQGIAKRKNECLRALKDCDYIFLLDDDCHPIKEGWVDFFINNAGNNHVMFLNDKLHNYAYTSSISRLKVYNDCGGVFMYIPKDALAKVGAFDEKFEGYGLEHANWSMRWMGGKKLFFMLKGTEEYIYAHDYSTPNHKSSITNEEKQKHVAANWDKFFNEPIKNIYLPL